MSKILSRVIRKTGVPNLIDLLTNRLSQSDLQSLLLAVYQQRAKQQTPGELLRQYRQNIYVQPAKLPVDQQIQFYQLAIQMLPEDAEMLELSPVAPFGSFSSVTPLHQSRTFTTIRNSEVCSDSTNLMALECAVRRKDHFAGNGHWPGTIRLCSNQRLLRTPVFPMPGAMPHFRVVGLCSAGRDGGSFRFELMELRNHLNFHLGLMQSAANSFSKPITSKRVLLMVNQGAFKQQLEQQLLPELSNEHPEVLFETVPLETQDYYQTIRFQLFATNRHDEEHFLADGGFTNWTAQLLSDRKERLMISGLGSDRFLDVF